MLALDAFLSKHRRCGDIAVEVTATHVFEECGGCGARLVLPIRPEP